MVPKPSGANSRPSGANSSVWGTESDEFAPLAGAGRDGAGGGGQEAGVPRALTTAEGLGRSRWAAIH